MLEHFPAKYIDEISKIGAESNYFSQVWAQLLAITGRLGNRPDIGCRNGIFASQARAETDCTLLYLEHLVHPEFVLREAFGVLKKRGELLAHTPNHFTLHGRLKFLFKNEIDTYSYFPTQFSEGLTVLFQKAVA